MDNKSVMISIDELKKYYDINIDIKECTIDIGEIITERTNDELKEKIKNLQEEKNKITDEYMKINTQLHNYTTANNIVIPMMMWGGCGIVKAFYPRQTYQNGSVVMIL